MRKYGLLDSEDIVSLEMMRALEDINDRMIQLRGCLKEGLRRRLGDEDVIIDVLVRLVSLNREVGKAFSNAKDDIVKGIEGKETDEERNNVNGEAKTVV